jgi:sec-independent protein translocase protein TatB
MFDIGVTKLLLVGGIALVVIGPERLPKVARMAGTLLGRAQRYVTEVKAEVNRSIELEELNRVKREFETAARDVTDSVNTGLNQASSEIDQAYAAIDGSQNPSADASGLDEGADTFRWEDPPPSYVRPNKHWRVKRGAVPVWYKRRSGLKQHVQSGAARVARHRPRRSAA